MTCTLRKLFSDTNLDELCTPQQVVILKDTATVEQALRTLASKRILSAPVVATSGEEAKGCVCLPLFGQAPSGAHWPQDKALAGNHLILGFLDVRDVVSSFIADLENSGGTSIKKMKMLQRMRLLEEKGQTFASTPIKDLQVFGGDGDFFHTSEAARTTLQDIVVYGLLSPKDRCLQAKLQGSARGVHAGKHTITGTVHRVAFYDSQFRISNIISQTDIIKFVYMNKAVLGNLANMTVSELGWDQRPVVSIGPDVSSIEAMVLMNEQQISAVAVVDGIGKIIGNFSVSEMRTIMAEHFGALSLPVGEFLALEHGTEFQGYSHIRETEVLQSPAHKFVTDRVARARPRTPGEEVGQNLVLTTPQATFLEVLEKIVSHKLHRVYVVDADEKPCGVVTCTDVLKLVTQRAQLRGASPAASSAAAADSQQQDQGQQQQQQQAEVMSVP